MRRDALNQLLSGASDGDREILPKNVKPTHYDLVIEPDLDQGTYQGTVYINLQALEDTTSISLNLKETKVTDSSVIISPKIIHDKDLRTAHDAKAEVLTIALGSQDTISAGTKFVLALHFEGSLDAGNGGFFRSSFKDPSSGELKWVASTQMEPVDARKAFPCFDEPALKTTFQVSLIAEHHLTCLGNMDIAREQTKIYGKRTKKVVTFNPTPPMSTYLVAFAVGEFNMLETKKWRVPIRIYAPPDQNIENARYALEISARVMELHEEAFGIKYPLPKVDQIQTAGNKGGMENWGLITYQPGILLWDKKMVTSTTLDKQHLVSTIAHELAHQWFGDIVTMEFWDGLWLNESFASWAQGYIQDKMFPEWETTRDFIAQDYQEALDMDANKASHPIQVPVKGPGDIDQIFDVISYRKGHSILRMLVDCLGIDDFISGVRNYLQKHAFGNSVTADLWQALDEASSIIDVRFFMANWTEKVGYPVLTVTEGIDSSEPNHIQIVQHRFLKSGKATAEEDQTKWSIPLNIRTETGIQPKFLSNRKAIIPVSSEFYKLNANQSGFYRVAYPPSRLLKLGQAAQQGILSVEDRIGIISDATALAASGFYDTPTVAVLDLLSSFSSEENYFVWLQLLSSFKSIRQAWLFSDDHAAILSFQEQLAEYCLERLGGGHANDDSDDNLKLFAALIFNAAGEAGYSNVIEAAKAMFAKWMDGYNNVIPIDGRESIFALAIRHGTDKEFYYLLNLYKSSPPPSSNPPPPSTILGALSHTQNPSHLSEILNLWLDCSYQDWNYFMRAIQSCALYPRSASMLWEFAKENFEALLEKARKVSINQTSRLISSILGGLSTFDHISDVKSFFYDEGRDLNGYDNVLRQAIDDMEAKAKWVERDGEDVGKWLEDNGYTKGENI